MTTTPTETTATEPDLDIPVLVALSDIKTLVPRAPQTVYRWRLSRNGKPPRLPLPALIPARTPLWRLDRILELMAEDGIEVDAAALARIRKSQGR